jgi:hypothetical protein
VNPRFKELRVEAVAHTNSLKPLGLTAWELTCNQKFAELIVNECARVLLAWKTEPFPFDEDVAADLIREHFGVEAPPSH